MRTHDPSVTVAMPVYNGERYMAAALDALLAQTFEDFEILICDNASTDGTRDIAEAYARRDRRVLYYRNSGNIGAAPNFNLAFARARGRYFRWAAHDDLCAPSYLAQTVPVLDADPTVVLSHTRVRVMDGQGDVVADEAPSDPGAGSADVAERMRTVMSTGHNCFEVFGLMRVSALRQTSLIGRFPTGDKALLVELSLLGRFHQVPEFSFMSRDHSSRYKYIGRIRDRALWFDTDKRGRLTFPQWSLVRANVSAIGRSRLGMRDRVRCYVEILRMLRWFQGRLLVDELRLMTAVGLNRCLDYAPRVEPTVRSGSGR